MRFFFLTEAPEALEGEWQPPLALARHLKALRIHPREDFLLLLPLGGAVRARWDGYGGTLQLLGLTEVPRLNLMPVTLATAWPKGSRADDLVVRATEAGIERIIPLVCERSVTGRRAFTEHRLSRWAKLAREACQQCGRPLPPMLESRPIPLRQVREEAPLAHPIALIPGGWPLAMELNLHAPREVLLLVGPEGGFSEEEEDWLRTEQISRAALFHSVLRIESAGPTAAAICQHWYYQLKRD